MFRLAIPKAKLAAAAALMLAMAPNLASAQNETFEARINEAKSSMMADSSLALKSAREAKTLVEGSPAERDQQRLTASWLEAEALLRLNRASEATEIAAATLKETAKLLPGTKLHADLLRSNGSMAAVTSDYGRALSLYQEAHSLYNQLGEKRSAAIALQNIGSLYLDARDYERVLRYYQQAKETFGGDAALSLSAHNNIGNALKDLGRLEEAESEFRLALEAAEGMDSPVLQARILTNIASVQFLRGRLDAAEETAAIGQSIAQKQASEWLPFVYGVRSQIALEKGQLGTAAMYLERTFGGQKLAETTPYFRDFHETGYETFRRLGDFRLASEHLAAFNRLDGQARDLSAKANNAILGARFEAAEREVRIARLSAEKQAKDALLADQRRRLFTLSALIGVGILMLLSGLLVLRNIARSRSAIAAANERLTYVTQHDSLTRLFSRDHFRSLLDEQLKVFHDTNEPSILMLVDLDRFKQINDIYGHATGDELLAMIGDRFREALGEDNMVGRLGGDEFGVILPDVSSAVEAMPIAHELIEKVSQPFTIDGFEMDVGASIGIAVIGKDGITNSDMMTDADLALYAAKHRGRGTAVAYASHMRMKLEEKSLLEADLSKALNKGEISISYQPIVRGQDREVQYYEALMRWDHPERGSVPPDIFIPIAEESLLIERLGAWMLKSACAEASKWSENIKLSVNISALQLSAKTFLNTVVEALASSGLPATRLVLEVTESMLLEMDEELDSLLVGLNELGVGFALDDFGRGYSSLSYIEKINFSMIKIDRSFVQSAADGSRRSEAIVSAIVSLARSLEIDVTAEGIEQEEQLQILSALGCACFQGFHIGRPSADINSGKELLLCEKREAA